MKKLSILCAFALVTGMMARSAFAQVCTVDADCNDGYYCNGEETCDVATAACMDGLSPCAENEICNEDTDTCFDGAMVSMDIKPGSCPGPLNVRSQGVLPVAILGSADIDVTTLDPATILITREGFDPIAPIRYSYDDVGAPSEGEPCACDDLDEDGLDEDGLDGDGITDLTLKFSMPELVEGLGLKEVASREIIPLTIMGETEDGTLIMGEDCVKIINKFKWWDDLLEKIKKPKKPKNGDEE